MLTALFIAISALMMTGCGTQTPQKMEVQSNLLLECRTPEDITSGDGASLLEALTDWGAALQECHQLNHAKALHIRSTSDF